MKKTFFILLIAAAAIAANIIFPGSKLAAIILAVILFIGVLPKLILFALRMDEKYDPIRRKRLMEKRAKEKMELEERLNKICREVTAGTPSLTFAFLSSKDRKLSFRSFLCFKQNRPADKPDGFQMTVSCVLF